MAVSCSKITDGSAARRRGVKRASTPGVDDAASSVDGCKRPTPEKLACSRAAGLDCVRPRKESADGYDNGNPSMARPGEGTSGAGLHNKKRRRKRHKLRKPRSGTETLQEMSAGQTSDTTWSVETLNVLTRTTTGLQYRSLQLENPPTNMHPFGSRKDEERSGGIKALHTASTTKSEDTLSAKTKKERFDGHSCGSLKASPFYDVLREHKDVIPDEIPAELPQDKGIHHEIDLVSVVVRQDKRGNRSPPHSAPTFCVKKPQGRWRIVHAYNKLNDATIPAQTPIPRKDVIIDSMAKSTIYSALDLCGGFYQILMRESDIPLTVSTPSGMLWEWLVMPQGLKNAPATCYRCVTHLLRSVRDFEPSYFDDLFIHSRDVNRKPGVEMHKEHLCKLLGLMRKHKLYVNLKKCIFGASEIPILGCLVGKNGVCPDPEKFLGPATYLFKYVENYAGKIHPAFDAVKQGLTEAPILVVADQDRPFHVVCDASDFAIGCALMQHDHEGRDRVVYYQSRQLKPAERNYPVHDKELLAMKYALAKFRVYLLGSGPFVVYTNHASLRTAVKSPHISQRMARWLSFFAEYDVRVEYKPGRLNVVAGALSCRPDYAAKTADANRIGIERVSAPSSSLIDDVTAAYASEADAKKLLSYASAPSDEAHRKLAPHLRARAHRYRVHEGLLQYSAVDDDVIRIVVPNDYDLRMRIMYEYHDVPTTGHPGREKTYLLLTRDFYWNHQYKWVRKYVRACEVCQRVKPAAFSQAPLQSLPTPSECWQSISMDFVFGLPPDSKRRTDVVVFVDRFSKMVHLAAVPAEVTAVQTAQLFVDMVFKHHGMRLDIVSDRDPRFTARFWQEVFTLLGTQLSMSTADGPQSDAMERLSADDRV
ncbi:hypothetical protein PC115_g11903 [Phytophthora cactorum]|uniref:Integrase catalytic domain-containing protein n=1 Tax=Phytophthora cactorum TaxID=29920 RepID=A0A8T1C2U7_9STRA|nr:hypothetical protein PC115_g11903 [Phytophthora cactorum]